MVLRIFTVVAVQCLVHGEHREGDHESLAQVTLGHAGHADRMVGFAIGLPHSERILSTIIEHHHMTQVCACVCVRIQHSRFPPSFFLLLPLLCPCSVPSLPLLACRTHHIVLRWAEAISVAHSWRVLVAVAAPPLLHLKRPHGNKHGFGAASVFSRGQIQHSRNLNMNRREVKNSPGRCLPPS